MTLGQNHDTISCHKQPLCEVGTSNVLLWKSNRSIIMHFSFQWPWTSPNDNNNYNHDTPSGHKQSFCKVIDFIRKIWTEHDCTDRQTERRTSWFLYTPKSLFSEVIITVEWLKSLLNLNPFRKNRWTMIYTGKIIPRMQLKSFAEARWCQVRKISYLASASYLCGGHSNNVWWPPDKIKVLHKYVCV